jgi:hypothetical protein
MLAVTPHEPAHARANTMAVNQHISNWQMDFKTPHACSPALLLGMCHSVGRISEHPHNASESPTPSHALPSPPSLTDLQCSLAQTLTLDVGAALTAAGTRLEAPHMESGVMTAAYRARGNEIRFGCTVTLIALQRQPRFGG